MPMAGLLEFFQAPFFSRTVKAEPFETHWITGIIYKLHKITGSFLFLCSCFVFAKELFRDHIRCIQDGSEELGSRITEDAFNSYCYISSTFTLPPDDVMRQFDGSGMALHLGVGPMGTTRPNDIRYHNYYQWVGYLLFAQSLSFFAPAMIHRFLQDGRAQRILADLHNIITFSETRYDQYGEIDMFFGDWYNQQNWWALKLTVCDVLNLVNVVLNIALVDWYLGNQFFGYGPASLGNVFSGGVGPDPFELIFPKLTKCTLHTYGPSGTIQNHDALCVMTVNVLNEKIYFLLWFILFTLLVITVVHHTAALIVISSRRLRKAFLVAYISPKKQDLRQKLSQILDLSGYGDWMMLLLVARNTDRVIFSEVIRYLHYPDYHRDLESLDEENVTLMRSRKLE